MDESEKRELAQLRARAFGRHADLDDAGLRRLHELEARARGATTGAVPSQAAPRESAPPAPGPSRAGAVPPRPPLPAHVAAGLAPATAAAPPRPAPPVAPARPAIGVGGFRISTRALVLAVTAAVVLALVATAISISTALSGPGRVATLAPSAGAAWPDELFGTQRDGSRAYKPFHGLNVVLVSDPWGSGLATPCLVVAQVRPQPRMLSTGCGAGDFPPTVAIEVAEGMPDNLIDQFPIGTGLQFVLRDDEVSVYAAAG